MAFVIHEIAYHGLNGYIRITIMANSVTVRLVVPKN